MGRKPLRIHLFKKRTLLLFVAVASLGAILVSTAIAVPTGTSNTPDSGVISVVGPQVTASLQNPVSPIPANGTDQNVADVFAIENDPLYTMKVVSVVLFTNHKVQNGTCTGFVTTVDNHGVCL